MVSEWDRIWLGIGVYYEECVIDDIFVVVVGDNYLCECGEV